MTGHTANPALRTPAWKELDRIRADNMLYAARLRATIQELRQPPRGEWPGESWQEQMKHDRAYTDGWNDWMAGNDPKYTGWDPYLHGWRDAGLAVKAGRATRAQPTIPAPQPTTPAPATATPAPAPSLAWSLPAAPRATRIPTPPTGADPATPTFLP